jgi:hypothetical protein
MLHKSKTSCFTIENLWFSKQKTAVFQSKTSCFTAPSQQNRKATQKI